MPVKPEREIQINPITVPGKPDIPMQPVRRPGETDEDYDFDPGRIEEPDEEEPVLVPAHKQ